MTDGLWLPYAKEDIQPTGAAIWRSLKGETHDGSLALDDFRVPESTKAVIYKMAQAAYLEMID